MDIYSWRKSSIYARVNGGIFIFPRGAHNEADAKLLRKELRKLTVLLPGDPDWLFSSGPGLLYFRVSFRACNGKYLAVKPAQGGGAHGAGGMGLVVAGSINLGEDEMMGVVRAGGGDAVVNLRIGKCLMEEREEAWQEDARIRSQV